MKRENDQDKEIIKRMKTKNEELQKTIVAAKSDNGTLSLICFNDSLKNRSYFAYP